MCLQCGNVTPDLSKSFTGAIPKTYKAKKQSKGLNKTGKRTQAWLDGQPKLKAIFKDNGITSCEIALKGCKNNYLLGFAHVTRRNNYSVEDLADPHVVVLACQSCHAIVDDASKMPKNEAEELLQNIVEARGW